MGVDIHLAARTKKRRTEAELKELNYRFEEACCLGYESEPIKLSDYNEKYYPDDTNLYYELSTLSRYYSEGYARGYFPDIYAAIEWFRRNFPEADILYDGDFDGIENTSVLTKEKQEELLDYWCKHGGLEYRNREPENPLFKRNCPVHNKQMIQYMWSGGNGAINCLACGYKEETKDKGITWEKIT